MTKKAVGLTKRQTELLNFLKRHYSRSEVAPTYREMQIALGYGSKAAIHRLVVGLEQRGHIFREPAKARAVALVEVPAFAKNSYNVVLPKDVQAQLQLLAEQAKTPPQQIIVEAVRSYIMEGA